MSNWNDRPRTIDTLGGWAVVWTLIYAANLPVAFFFGWNEMDRASRWGMYLGIALAWVIAGGLFGADRMYRRIGWWGGVCTALSQTLLGLPQILAGSAAMNLATSLGFEHPLGFSERAIPGTEWLWGLTTTVTTAGLMCLGALSFGVLITTALESWNPPPTRWTFAKPTGTGLGDFE